MAGPKPDAKVVRFFQTDDYTDTEIVALLKIGGIAVSSHGPGGFPTCDVFHLDDFQATWVGSRLDSHEGKVLVFFSEQEDDPIFKAVKTFATEITGAELEILTSALAKAKRARTEKETAERIARVEKTRSAQAKKEMVLS